MQRAATYWLIINVKHLVRPLIVINWIILKKNESCKDDEKRKFAHSYIASQWLLFATFVDCVVCSAFVTSDLLSILRLIQNDTLLDVRSYYYLFADLDSQNACFAHRYPKHQRISTSTVSSKWMFVMQCQTRVLPEEEKRKERWN